MKVKIISSTKNYNNSDFYSSPSLVCPYTEELISLPFMGEIPFRFVLEKRMGTESARGCLFLSTRYSLVHLVLPNTESLISQPFMGLSKIRLLLQDRVSPRYVRFFWRYHIFHLLFCPTHTHIIRSSVGIAGSICSEAGRLDLFAEKSNRPASEQILL